MVYVNIHRQIIWKVSESNSSYNRRLRYIYENKLWYCYRKTHFLKKQTQTNTQILSIHMYSSMLNRLRIVTSASPRQLTSKILDFCSKSHFQTKIYGFWKKNFHQNIQCEKLFRLTDCIRSQVSILGVSYSHWILPSHDS